MRVDIRTIHQAQLLASTGGQQDAKKDAAFCVAADLLIPGKGDRIENACIVVEHGKIKHVGSKKDVVEQFAHLRTTHVKILMPGMWDCHIHLAGLHSVSLNAMLDSQQSPILAGARTARDCMLLMNCGFTSVREMAGYGLQLAKAIDEGSLVGPSIYSCNAIISPTGGHADIHDLHKEWYDDACAHGMPCALADGVAECLKQVRMQLRAGAKVIKICASGGVASNRDDPINQQFSDEEMKTIVEEAARAQRIVGAHCHGKGAIMAALKAGVKTVEHGSYVDAEVCDLILEKKAMLVPTRTIIEIGLELSKGFFDPSGYMKLHELAEAHWTALKTAIKKGVPIATGCDIPGSVPGNNTYTHGRNGRELVYLVKAGMSPLQAIEAATANGPLTLGPQGPKAGQLKAGFDADFIALDQNPLDDIETLDGPEHVTHVWKAGTCYKSPGHPISSI